MPMAKFFFVLHFGVKKIFETREQQYTVSKHPDEAHTAKK